jgi:hypothetical protein
MTDQQNTNSTADAVPGESLKDGAQNQISPAADALSDSSLDKVSGGSWPYGTAVYASIGGAGPGG